MEKQCHYLGVFIQPKDLNSIFVDAIEGGINYWVGELPEIERCEGDSEYYSERFWQHIRRGESITITDEDGETTGTINLKSVDKAIKLLIRDYPKRWAEIKEEEYDAITADVFFQLCAFGEIIFG